nr:hypothetical protein CFP56_78720 [Quercus suber]
MRLPSNHGEYTTQSAYQLLARKERNLLPSSSSGGDKNQIWKGIWNLQVPHKVKHLLWRATNEALPILYNLLCKNVVKSAYCPNCMFDGEDMIHALWSCKQLLVIWEDDAELMKCRKKLILFADLLAVLLTRKDRVDVDLLAMILWLIGPEEMLLDWANLPLNTIRFKLELCCTCWSINLPRCVTEG